MGQPTELIKILSLSKNSKLCKEVVMSVTMMGCEKNLSWKQKSNALGINKPPKSLDWQTIGFKIEFKK